MGGRIRREEETRVFNNDATDRRVGWHTCSVIARGDMYSAYILYMAIGSPDTDFFLLCIL